VAEVPYNIDYMMSEHGFLTLMTEYKINYEIKKLARKKIFFTAISYSSPSACKVIDKIIKEQI
jgi:hypothetical protein